MYSFPIGIFINSRASYASPDALKAALRFAFDNGVAGAQLYAYPELLEMGRSAGFRREIAVYARALGLEITALCGDMGIRYHCVERGRELEEYMRRAFDVATALGTNIVTTHVGVVPEDTRHERYTVMQDTFGAIARIAEERGAYLANETGPETARVLKEFLDGVGSRASAVNFDPANIVMSTNEPLEGALEILAPYIRHTHAKDAVFIKPCDLEVMYGLKRDENYNGDDYFKETLIGSGDIDWKTYLRALYNTGYRGFLTIEREGSRTHEQDIIEEVKTLKEFMYG